VNSVCIDKRTKDFLINLMTLMTIGIKYIDDFYPQFFF